MDILLALFLPILWLYLFSRLFVMIETEYPKLYQSMGEPKISLAALTPVVDWNSFVIVIFPREIKKGSQSHKYIWMIRIIIFTWLALVFTYAYKLYITI